MTWLAQVRHVMAKDVREARWPLAAYAVVVALATAHATSWMTRPAPLLDASMLVVVLLGMLVVSLLVQSDSPTRSDAFWVSHPFIPSAMFAAKVAVAAVVVIGLPLIGQLAALSAHRVIAENIPRLLAESVWAYWRWLLVALVAAALTKDIRSVVLTVIVVPIALIVVFGTFTGTNEQTSTTAQSVIAVILPVVGLGGGLGLLFALYRKRDTRRRTWFAGFIILACLLLSIAMPWPSRADVIDAPASVPRATLTLHLQEPDHLAARPDLQVGMSVEGGSAVERLWLTNAVVLVHLRNGSILRLASRTSFAEFLPREMPAKAGVVWSGTRSNPESQSGLSFNLTYDQRKAIAAGVSSIGLEGRLSASDPQIVGTIPLEQGATFAHDGRQVRIAELTRGFGDVSVDLVATSLDQGREPSPSGYLLSTAAPQYALLNEARGEAVLLYSNSGSGGSDYLVMPGPQIHRTSQQFHALSRRENDGAPVLDDTWFRGARLMIVKWFPRGGYPVHAELTVPQQAP